MVHRALSSLITCTKPMSAYTYKQLRDALQEVTGYDLEKVRTGDGYLSYALVDGCGDQDGDLFDELDDVADYITNNIGVQQYLETL